MYSQARDPHFIVDQFGRADEQAIVRINAFLNPKDIELRNTITDYKDEHVIYGFTATDDNNFKKYGPTIDETIMRVDVNDLLYTLGSASGPRQAHKDCAFPAMSALNGIFARKHKRDRRTNVLDLNLLAKEIRFMGVHLGVPGNILAKNPAQRQSQFVCAVNGTKTILNKSGQTILPGSTVLWDIPTPKEHQEYVNTYQRTAHNPDKVTFSTVSLDQFRYRLDIAFDKIMNADADTITYHPVDNICVEMKRLVLFGLYANAIKVSANIASSFEDFCNKLIARDDSDPIMSAAIGVYDALRSPAAPGEPDLVKELRHVFDSTLLRFIELEDDVRRRTIGKAMSLAKPGAPLDLMIGV